MSDLISREAVLKEIDERHKNGDAITKGFIKNLPSVEPQNSADRERVIALRVNNKTCVQCKHYECFDKKEFPCIDCMLDCKDRFEPKPAEQTEWISVKDRLPKYNGEYYVTYEDCNGMRDTDVDYFRINGKGWVYYNVIAWREKFSPYKGE